MLLVVFQLSRDVIGYENSEMSLVRLDPIFVTVEESFTVIQIVNSPAT